MNGKVSVKLATHDRRRLWFIVWEAVTITIVCFLLLLQGRAANNNALMGLLVFSLFVLYMTSFRFLRIERRMAVWGFITIALAIAALIGFPIFAE